MGGLRFWISCPKFTVLVVVNLEGVVIDTAPITRRFVGQGIEKLVGWARNKFGDVEIEEL